jgi:hypothetical protein
MKDAPLTKLDMIHLAQDVMVSVAERDIYTGFLFIFFSYDTI